MRKRKICVVTGTRAEFGLLEPVMREIQNDNELELVIAPTGMHLSHLFGNSIKEIERAFPPRIILPIKGGMMITGGKEYNQFEQTALDTGRYLSGAVDVYKNEKPDIVLVLGDRSEILAAAVAAAYCGLCVAHIHGGDVSRAGLDDSARHAITKFAHLHFTATKKARERVLKLGERPKYVFNYGAPGLDSILNTKTIPRTELCQKLGIDAGRNIIVVIQHPVTTGKQVRESGKQMRATLDALRKFPEEQVVLIYPNNDAGFEDIIDAIEKFNHPHCAKFKNIEHDVFISLMKHASVMAGNSSSGVIESASFKIPVVNIGTRQQGRERGANVLDCPHEAEKIRRALKRALTDKKFLQKVKRAKSPYGNGTASKRIVKVLREIKIDEKLLQKELTY